MAVGETLKILDTTMPLHVKPVPDAKKRAYEWLQSVYACQRGVQSALNLPNDTPQSKELVSVLRYVQMNASIMTFYLCHR